MLSIEICMGSSCYSRGNSKSLEIVESFIEEKKINAEIKLSGNLCLGCCSEGPNITVNGTLHKKCDPDCVIDLLRHYLEEV